MHASFPDKGAYTARVKALWARARELSIDDETVRDIAEQVSGRRSVSSMSLDQFNAWFDWVDERYGPKKKKPRRRRLPQDPGKVIELATPEQKAKIRSFARNDLRWEDGWTPDGRDCVSITRIIEKHSRGKKHKIDQLTKQQAISVIEALKAIHERKHHQTNP